MRNKKTTWRAVAVTLAAILVFTLMPASAFAVGVEPSSGLSVGERAQDKYADSLKGDLNGSKAAKGAAGASDVKHAMLQKILGNKSIKESIRKKIASLYSQGGGAAALGTDYTSQSIISPGALTVDENIATLPYTDSKTIDKDTHKITWDLTDGLDEEDDSDGITSLELRGYIYKVTFKKGAGYSLKITSGAPEEFFPLPFIFDGNGDLSEAMFDEDEDTTTMDEDTSIIVARKSGTHYIMVFDALELASVIMPIPGMPAFKGGTYNLTLDKAYYISGTVKNRKGKPIKNVWVEMLTAKTKYVNDVYLNARTDVKGKYKIFGAAPGKYRIRYFKDTSSAKPKYRLEYYNNKYSFKKAKLIKIPSGKNKTGVNVRLSAYKPPNADKRVKKLPFKTSSKLYIKPREVLTTDGDVVPARVYSVKLNKGYTYGLTLNGKKLYSPVAEITDGDGYYATGFEPQGVKDGNMAMGSFTPPKTDIYRIAVYDKKDTEDYLGALGGRKGKFSLSVSKAFIPGSISGNVTRAGGYPADGIYVTVYKKYGKRWVSYMWDRTNKEGKYTVRGLNPGEYKVRFSYYHDEEDGDVKFFKNGKAVGVKTKGKASKVKVNAGVTTREINIRF